MTITMTEKHQITIPKKIASVFDLKKGSMFEVKVRENAIELIPVEVFEKKFTAKQYAKLEKLYQAEKGKTKRVSKAAINTLKKGKV